MSVAYSEGTHRLAIDAESLPLDALLKVPAAPVAQLLLAHGAGAGFEHATMQTIADACSCAGIATLRFNFPYMQRGRRRVGSQAEAVQSIVAATNLLRDIGTLPLFLGGHSYGGRMCSHAALEPDVDCAGLIFTSFPLHPAKKPGIERAAHLGSIGVPMLFLSGTRDELADAALLEQVVRDLHDARIHWLDTANHSYVVLKRARKNPMSVFVEIATAARQFVDETIR